MLQVKIHHTGHTAAGRCNGPGLIIILGIGTHKGHAQVGMRINGTGQKIKSLGINDFIRRVVQINPDRFDFVAICKNIGHITTGRINDCTAFK